MQYFIKYRSNQMQIVDSHCHLDILTNHFTLEEILEKAQDAEVAYMHTISINIRNIKKILKIANKSDKIFASIGVHPNEVNKEGIINIENLLPITKNPKIISIGESGLDYSNHSAQKDKKLQTKSFITHIRASQQTGLPIVVHTRNAELDTQNILLDLVKEKYFSGVIHCFTGSKEFAKYVLDLGLYISISGIVTFKKSIELKNLLKYIPLDRLLCETDSPYLSPEPFRGKINDPSRCKYTLMHISKILNLDFNKLCEITTNNFFHLFTKAKKYT